jgi:hypothetical protein
MDYEALGSFELGDEAVLRIVVCFITQSVNTSKDNCPIDEEISCTPLDCMCFPNTFLENLHTPFVLMFICLRYTAVCLLLSSGLNCAELLWQKKRH